MHGSGPHTATDVELSPLEGIQLSQMLKAMPKLTSLDVRSNDTLGEEGVSALEAFMKTQKTVSSTSVAHSLCGITPAKSRLEVPQEMSQIEVCARTHTRRDSATCM